MATQRGNSEADGDNEGSPTRRTSSRQRKSLKRFSPVRDTSKSHDNSTIRIEIEGEEDEPKQKQNKSAKKSYRKRRPRVVDRNIKLEMPPPEDGDEYLDVSYRSTSQQPKINIFIESEGDVKTGMRMSFEGPAHKQSLRIPSFSERYYHFEELDPSIQEGVTIYDTRSIDSIEEAVGVALVCVNETPEKLCSAVPNGLPSATAEAVFVLDMLHFVDDSRIKFDKMFGWKPLTRPDPKHKTARPTDAPRMYEFLGPVTQPDGTQWHVKQYSSRRTMHDRAQTFVIRNVYWVYASKEPDVRAKWAVVTYKAPLQPLGYKGYLTKKLVDDKLSLIDDSNPLAKDLCTHIRYQDSSDSEYDMDQNPDDPTSTDRRRTRKKISHSMRHRVFTHTYDFDEHDGTNQELVTLYASDPVNDANVAVQLVHNCVSETPDLLSTDVPHGLPCHAPAAVYIISSDAINNDQRMLIDRMAGWVQECNIYPIDQPQLLELSGPIIIDEMQYFVKRGSFRRKVGDLGNKFISKQVYWIYDQPEAMVSRFVLISYEAVNQPNGFSGKLTTLIKGLARILGKDAAEEEEEDAIDGQRVTRARALNEVESQPGVQLYSNMAVVDTVDAVRNVVACMEETPPPLCDVVPICLPPDVNSAVYIVDGTKIADQASVRVDGMRHWKDVMHHRRAPIKPIPLCLDMSGPYTVDGQVNYYVREMSLVRQCDDRCRTVIKKELYWVYDLDDAYETDAPARWIIVSYKIMSGSLHGLSGAVPPATPTLEPLSKQIKRRAAARVGRPATRASTSAHNDTLDQADKSEHILPPDVVESIKADADELLQDGIILNYPKHPERFIVTMELDSFVVIRRLDTNDTKTTPYSCTCPTMRSNGLVCGHALAVAKRCNNESVFNTLLNPVRRRSLPSRSSGRIMTASATASNARVPVLPLNPHTTFSANMPESTLTQSDQIHVYSEIACISLAEALTISLTCEKLHPDRMCRELPYHMVPGYRECTFVVDATDMEDKDAILDTMGDWDANVKNQHVVLRASKLLGDGVYSVKKRYQKNCDPCTEAQLGRHIFWVYEGKYGRETRMAEKKARYFVVSYKWLDGNPRPLPNEWLTKDRPQTINKTRVCAAMLSTDINPPCDPEYNLDRAEEIEMTGSPYLSVYSRQACQNIHAALSIALLCSRSMPERLCREPAKRLPRGWPAVTYVLDAHEFGEEEEKAVMLDEMGDWSGPCMEPEEPKSPKYKWKQRIKHGIFHAPAQYGGGTYSVRGHYQKNYEPACEGQLCRHIFYVWPGELTPVDCQITKATFIVVSYYWKDGVVRELPAEMKTTCWVDKIRFTRKATPCPKFLENMCIYRDLDASNCRLPANVNIYADTHCVFINNAVIIGLDAERNHPEVMSRDFPNGIPEGWIAVTYVIDGQYVFDRDATCDGLPNWTSAPALGHKNVAQQYKVTDVKIEHEDGSESMWTVKKSMSRNGHRSTDYKLNRYIYWVYEGAKQKPKESKAKYIVISYHWIDGKPRQLPGFLTEDNRRMLSALHTRRRPSEVINERSPIQGRTSHHTFRYKSNRLILPKPYRKGLGAEYRAMESTANRLYKQHETIVKKLDDVRWSVWVSDSEQYIVVKDASGEYHCTCKQFSTSKFTCPHTMLLVLVNEEVDDFRTFVYREVDRPMFPGKRPNLNLRRGRPRRSEPRYADPEGDEYEEIEDTYQDEDFTIPGPPSSKRLKQEEVLPESPTITSHEYSIILQKAADFYADGLVLQYPKEDNLYAVMVDKTTFNVSYRGGLLFVCNCDQFEALAVVCMHTMAVAMSLGVAQQYRRKCQPFIDKQQHQVVQQQQHAAVPEEATVMMLNDDDEEYWG